MKSAIRALGVVVRGFSDRRLVVGAPNSLEPMTVSLPVRDIRQIAVLRTDPTDPVRRFTVAAQIDSDKWVRLGVFDSAVAAEELIRACAHGIAGTRWKQVWMTLALSIVAGFVLLVVANVLQTTAGAKRAGALPQQVPPELVVAPQAPVAAAPVAPPAPVVPQVSPQPAAAAPAATSIATPPLGQQSQLQAAPPPQEQVLKDYFSAQPAKK